MAPLTGVRVLEVGQLVAAPFAGKLLAALGAEVVKVEPYPAGDPARRVGGFPVDGPPDPDRSALFLYMNTGKLGVTMNLELPSAREIFRRLVGMSDIVVSDIPPADAEAWQLDHEGLQKVGDRVILVSVTPFGTTGPYRDFRAHEINVFHGGGEGFLVGAGLSHEMFPERPPVMAGGYVADQQTGITAAVGAVAALLARELTGQGQHVDVSGQDAQISLNHLAAMRYVDGTLESRDNRALTFGGVVQCRDGYAEILPLEQHQWESLIHLMGDPTWASDARFLTGRDRAQNGAEINRRIRDWARDRTRAEIFEQGQRLGCPIGPYYGPAEVLADEQLLARGFFEEIEHPIAGSGRYPGLPFDLNGERPAGRHAPMLGEHNDLVLRDRLGLTADEITRSRRTGVL